MAVKGMPDNESATEKCTLGRKSSVFEVILKRRWKTFFPSFVINWKTLSRPNCCGWVASGLKRWTRTLCICFVPINLCSRNFSSTWHIHSACYQQTFLGNHVTKLNKSFSSENSFPLSSRLKRANKLAREFESKHFENFVLILLFTDASIWWLNSCLSRFEFINRFKRL